MDDASGTVTTLETSVEASLARLSSPSSASRFRQLCNVSALKKHVCTRHHPAHAGGVTPTDPENTTSNNRSAPEKSVICTCATTTDAFNASECGTCVSIALYATLNASIVVNDPSRSAPA